MQQISALLSGVVMFLSGLFGGGATSNMEASSGTPSISITEPAVVTLDSKNKIMWEAENVPSGAKVAVFTGIYIKKNIRAQSGEVALKVPSYSRCGDVSGKVKELTLVLYEDPDNALTRWCTTKLPNGAPDTKNIIIYAQATIPVLETSQLPLTNAQ